MGSRTNQCRTAIVLFLLSRLGRNTASPAVSQRELPKRRNPANTTKYHAASILAGKSQYRAECTASSHVGIKAWTAETGCLCRPYIPEPPLFQPQHIFHLSTLRIRQKSKYKTKSALSSSMSKLSFFISQYPFYLLFRKAKTGGKTPESLPPVCRNKRIHAVGRSIAFQRSLYFTFSHIIPYIQL